MRRHRMLERFSHAVDHLIFERVRRYTKGLRRCLDHRQTAEIVGAECRTDHITVPKQQGSQCFVIRVRVGFLLKQRNRPSGLPIANGVRIPIGSLYQTNRHRNTPPLRPGNKIAHILFRLTMIGLQSNTGMGKYPTGLFVE